MRLCYQKILDKNDEKQNNKMCNKCATNEQMSGIIQQNPYKTSVQDLKSQNPCSTPVDHLPAL